MFKTKLALALVTTLSLTACFDSNKVAYTCEEGKTVSVAYTIPTNPEEKATAVVHLDGKKIAMTAAESASGALYVADDVATPYNWNTKENTGSLTLNKETVLKGCTSAPVAEEAPAAEAPAAE